MGDSNRTIEYWSERWKEGKTGWHNGSDVHYALRNHGGKLVPASKHRVFIPLCGKTLDLKWFYDAGHTVVGVEGVEKAVLEFFTEHNLSYVTETLSWGKLYKTEDNRLLLYCCDLFNMDVEALGKFDAVWDRGSLVAINKQEEERYAGLMKSVLAADFRYLLSVLVYTPNEIFSGPPRNVPPHVVKTLYGECFHVEELEKVLKTKDDPKLEKWGLEQMHEVTLLLTPTK